MSDENRSNSKKNFADQQDGKKPLDVETNAVNAGFQAIAAAYGDYTKKSFEDTKSFVKKLSSVKSLDQAIEVQTEFARTTCETFVEESQKIAALYGDLAKQTYGGFVTLSR
jgi:phasin family protein